MTKFSSKDINMMKKYKSIPKHEWNMIQQALQVWQKRMPSPIFNDALRNYSSRYKSQYYLYNTAGIDLAKHLNSAECAHLRNIYSAINHLDTNQINRFMNIALPNAVKSTELKYPDFAKNLQTPHHTTSNNETHTKPNRTMRTHKTTYNQVHNSLDDIIYDNRTIIKDIIYSVLIDMIGTVTTQEFNYFIKILLRGISNL